MDCGADPNILSVRVFELLSQATKASLQPCNVQLIAANGEGIDTIGQVTVPLHLIEDTLHVPVIVADIGDTAGILGMQFLRDADCSIAFKQGVLRCGGREWQLTSHRGVEIGVQRIRIKDLPEHLATLAQNADDTLSTEQSGLVKDLLVKFSDVFVTSDGKVGTTNLVKHVIDTGNAIPVKTPYRPPAFAKRAIIEENLDQMLKDDIIEPSKSPWSSPVVLAKKKDGSNRFCVDLRRLNSITKKDAYPLPNINDCLGSLSGAKWFTTLDMASGYWQVELEESAKEKTAFAPHRGLYQFKKMPFGLTNAPATFMRLMETVLREVNWDQCLVYLDDIIVFGDSFEQCLQRLGNVFRCLKEAGLKLKPSKCQLFKRQVSFLGHIVGKDGIACDPEKIDKVKNWPTPRSVEDVRSFLGLANYYKRFIKNFSGVARPMTALTRKDAPFNWDESCTTSFQTLKEALISAPILAYPSSNANDKFILDTDASEYGIGAVLSQMQDGIERVIAYASQSLSAAQRSYCTTYRELLALVEFAPYFKQYLLGRHFLVRTDHSSLRWLLNFKEAEGLIGRWLAKLANFNYEIAHRAGSNHANADAMSRNPLIKRRRRCGRNECQECRGTEAPRIKCTVAAVTRRSTRLAAGELESSQRPEPSWAESWSIEELKRLQEQDAAIQTVTAWLRSGNGKPSRQALKRQGSEVRDLCGIWPNLVIEQGILHRKWSRSEQGDMLQVVVPEALRDAIFHQIHASRTGGHLGVKKSVAKVRDRFFWPRAKSDIERWCRECNDCAQARSGPQNRAALQQDPVGRRFQRVAIDIMGELPETSNGNKYVLVLCDYFTKWTQAFALKDQTAYTVADTLMTQCFNLFGLPQTIHSDQGRNFESDLFQELCKLLGIDKTRTTPYHPQSDGMVERFNRTLQQMLKSFVNENRDDWDDHLPYLMMAYRSSPHESTGLSPNLMMFGEEAQLPIDLMVGAPPRHDLRYKCRVEYVEWLRRATQRAYETAREQLGVTAKRQKHYYDASARQCQYQTGSYVWYWYPPNANRKLGKGWTGPYRIMEKPTEVHCVIQETPAAMPRRVHVNKLKPHLGRIPPQWADYIEPTKEADEAPDTSSIHDDITDPCLARTQHPRKEPRGRGGDGDRGAQHVGSSRSATDRPNHRSMSRPNPDVLKEGR